MKSFLRILLVLSLGIFSLGNRGCITTDTVVLPEGPRATELSKTKDDQIAGLAAQVKAEQTARELEAAQASLAAADFETILFAATHLTPGLPRNAIEEEAKLGKARSPAPNAAEIIKGKDRVIAILQNDVAAAQAAYGQAFNEAAQAKAVIATKDGEIAKRDQDIKGRDGEITKLTEAAKTERAQHASDVKDALEKKDAEIKKIKDDAASKERATWVLWTRLAGLAFIVGGAVIAIVFHIVPEGAAFVGVGVLIGLVSIFIDWLTGQKWFPYACGGTILIMLAIGGYALYRMWKKNELLTKVTAVIQDIKDESTTLGNNLASQVEEHLTYRLGDKGKQQLTNLSGSLGLTNVKADTEKK